MPTIAWGRNSPTAEALSARAHSAQVQNFTLAIDDDDGAMAWADLRSERNGGRRRDKALGDKLQNNEALTLRFFPNIPFYSSLPLLPFPQRASSSLPLPPLLSSRFSSLLPPTLLALALPVICHFHSVLMVANRLRLRPWLRGLE